jgi:hypothetical protein
VGESPRYIARIFKQAIALGISRFFGTSIDVFEASEETSPVAGKGFLLVRSSSLVCFETPAVGPVLLVQKPADRSRRKTRVS